MLFYFKTTTDNKLPAPATLPVRRIESDCSAPAEGLLPSQPEDSTLDTAHLPSPTEHTDSNSSLIDNEISSKQDFNAAFIELVGEEYTFPL